MHYRFSPGPNEYGTLNTEQLRAVFLVDSLFEPASVQLVYSDADRAIVGSVVPADSAIDLKPDVGMRASFFCERREAGVLNIGGQGRVTVDGRDFLLNRLDCLYIGRGSREVRFLSVSANDPAAFYLVSYPAHADFPTALATIQEITAVELGSAADANRRSIYKYIHPAGIRSCQLVMGVTRLAEGSVWNTMPPHTHDRRSEVYLYFDLGPEKSVMHFMGLPRQTRHIVVNDRQAVISPSWSIHSGCGTGGYAFCWAMGGENQVFDDMDPAPASSLR